MLEETNCSVTVGVGVIGVISRALFFHVFRISTMLGMIKDD
jgi:hypothetical protein